MPTNNEWPPQGGYMAGDAHDLIGWKRWIDKERAADRRPTLATFSHKPLLQSHMSTHSLMPDPAYLPASCHTKGKPRHDWARFAGHPTAGYDPVVGYSARWAQARTRKSTPFTAHRSASTSNLAELTFDLTACGCLFGLDG